MSKLKVAIYARVSLGVSHGQSVENQLLQLREYAKQRSWEVYDEFADTCSGVKERRPALDALMKAAFQRKFQVMLVSALDRCSRSVSHMLGMVEELQHRGVSLVSVREQIDLSGPQGKLMLTMLAALSAMERDILRDRVKTGMAMRRLAAEKLGQAWRCGRSPISQEMIEKVLELRTAGYSMREIEKQLERKVSKAAIHRIIHEHADRLAVLSQMMAKERS